MIKIRKSIPFSQADFDQIHAFLEESTAQHLSLPNLASENKSGVYYFSCSDPSITNFREQFHLHISYEPGFPLDSPYLNIKYLRIPQSLRRQKLGQRIAKFLIEYVEGKGFGGVHLVAKNKKAFLFWQSVGFKMFHGAMMEYKFKPKKKETNEENVHQPGSHWSNLATKLLSYLMKGEGVS